MTIPKLTTAIKGVDKQSLFARRTRITMEILERLITFLFHFKIETS